MTPGPLFGGPLVQGPAPVPGMAPGCEGCEATAPTPRGAEPPGEGGPDKPKLSDSAWPYDRPCSSRRIRRLACRRRLGLAGRASASAASASYGRKLKLFSTKHIIRETLPSAALAGNPDHKLRHRAFALSGK